MLVLSSRSLVSLSFSLMLSLFLWVKDERALHIKSLWYNPVTQSSNPLPSTKTSNPAPQLSQEQERRRSAAAYLRETLSKHAEQSEWILLCSVHVAPWKGYFKLPCVYTHVLVKWPTHIAVYTNPSPRPLRWRNSCEAPSIQAQTGSYSNLVTASWRDTDPGIDWWGRNCKIHQGDLVI